MSYIWKRPCKLIGMDYIWLQNYLLEFLWQEPNMLTMKVTIGIHCLLSWLKRDQICLQSRDFCWSDFDFSANLVKIKFRDCKHIKSIFTNCKLRSIPKLQASRVVEIIVSLIETYLVPVIKIIAIICNPSLYCQLDTTENLKF